MPSQYSDFVSSSLIGFSAQNSAGILIGVASQVTALAPFSQNSNVLRRSGSGQAQLMQSKPSRWFIAVSAFRLRGTPICRKAGPSAWVTPGTPAAHSLGLPTSILSSSISSTLLIRR